MYVIPDIFLDITTAVATEYGSPVYFMHGHRTEIVNILSQKDRSDEFKFKKYPVVILHHDIKKSHGNTSYEFEDCKVNIVIATESSIKFDANDRYDNSFKNELYPILEEFLRQLKRTTKIQPTGDGENYQYDATDRLYWGKQSIAGNTANALNDAIDAIEINLSFNQLYELTNCY